MEEKEEEEEATTVMSVKQLFLCSPTIPYFPSMTWTDEDIDFNEDGNDLVILARFAVSKFQNLIWRNPAVTKNCPDGS